MPFRIFARLRTQWLSDYGRRTGLIYSSIPLYFELEKVARQDRSDVMDAIQTMELEWLQLDRKES